MHRLKKPPRHLKKRKKPEPANDHPRIIDKKASPVDGDAFFIE
jgi:hypothetical protein